MSVSKTQESRKLVGLRNRRCRIGRDLSIKEAKWRDMRRQVMMSWRGRWRRMDSRSSEVWKTAFRAKEVVAERVSMRWAVLRRGGDGDF